MICVKSLTKRYNTTLALDHLSLEIPDGTVLAFWVQMEQARPRSCDW